MASFPIRPPSQEAPTQNSASRCSFRARAWVPTWNSGVPAEQSAARGPMVGLGQDNRVPTFLKDRGRTIRISNCWLSCRNMIGIYIVEDDEDFLLLLTRDLSKAKKVRIVGTSPNAEKALRELPHVNPDVVLMDIKLPGMNGIECLRRMRRLSPPLRCHVLMLTGREDTDLVFDAIKSGASGYLVKG